MGIAFPIAGYAMKHCLADFAYRINLDWWVFALAGLLTIDVALVTVSYRTIKAALINPIKSLRSE
jgi:putative ABC transport system permease protein